MWLVALPHQTSSRTSLGPLLPPSKLFVLGLRVFCVCCACVRVPNALLFAHKSQDKHARSRPQLCFVVSHSVCARVWVPFLSAPTLDHRTKVRCSLRSMTFSSLAAAATCPWPVVSQDLNASSTLCVLLSHGDVFTPCLHACMYVCMYVCVCVCRAVPRIGVSTQHRRRLAHLHAQRRCRRSPVCKVKRGCSCQGVRSWRVCVAFFAFCLCFLVTVCRWRVH